MKPLVLCILDGFGLNPDTTANAVKLAHTPVLTKIWNSCPRATLVTSGEQVGLPPGQMGNSEVGHLNIGAGRVVEQWLLRIKRELTAGELPKKKSYQTFLSSLHPQGTIHLIGLVSNGGVHSHYDHLFLLLQQLRRDTESPVALHIITDGRDTSPESSIRFIERVETACCQSSKVTVATVIGRLWAMDRDKRWERTKKAYDLIVQGAGEHYSSALDAVKASHARGITDEYIEPSVINAVPVKPEDSFLFWNFREDRMRQIVEALGSGTWDESRFPRSHALPPAERVLGFTDYDHTFGLPSLFEPLDIKNHLGEVISHLGLKQIRIAETEKYPHVTYFLNGGVEKTYPGEDRSMVPSPRDVKTYDLKPEMSAAGVTELVVKALQARVYSLIIVNFANCDMVGHSGVLAAAISAVETVDTCVGEILPVLRSMNGQMLIFADHGNAELMMNYVDETPHTAHTTFPVPVMLVDGPPGVSLRDDGALCDIAPTALELLGIPAPAEMTGVSLLLGPKRT